ncbi:MAG: metalloregulator ArsR/SmtB family transcription factor [Actinomycetota bacterium]
MNPQVNRPISEIKAELFKALAHPARIRTLELLAERPRSVAELLLETGLEASHLSQQLAVLRRAGLVNAHREGSSSVYEICDPQLVDVLAAAKRVLINSLSSTYDLLEDLRAARL